MTKEQELEARIEELEMRLSGLTVSYRQIGENVKLLEYMKYVDFMLVRNILNMMGAKQEWYDDRINDVLRQWKTEAEHSLPKEYIPPEIRRVLLSHVEETEIRIRNELIKIKEAYEEEKGNRW